jgi:hypothetical protein
MIDSPGSALAGWLAERAAAGRFELAQTMRALTLRRDPETAALLPFEQDEAFLDPSLFAFFADGGAMATLPQLLFSSLDLGGAAEFPVRSDEAGAVFLPRRGTLRTAAPAADLLLRQGARGLELRSETGPVSSSFEAALLVGELQLLPEVPALFRFLAPPPPGRAPAPPPAREALLSVASTAADALAQAAPGIALCLFAHVRSVILCDSPDLNSFAAPQAHGAVFLCVSQITVPGLVEELAHQGGHVVFGAATLEPGRLLTVEPASPMARYSGVDRDTRSVYEGLHGIVTEALMVQVLSGCLAVRDWSGEEALELRGRLAYIGLRALTDLRSFSTPGLFTAEGSELLGMVADAISVPLRQHGRELRGLDLSNQPYAFSPSALRAANPQLAFGTA